MVFWKINIKFLFSFLVALLTFTDCFIAKHTETSLFIIVIDEQEMSPPMKMHSTFKGAVSKSLSIIYYHLNVDNKLIRLKCYHIINIIIINNKLHT